MYKGDLKIEEYEHYYWRYIDKINEKTSLRESFDLGKIKVTGFFSNIPNEKHDYSYEDGKWSCKEILQHLIDTERIFYYRCFRIARGDETELAGFDQNIYIEPSGAKRKSMFELVREYILVRDNSIMFLKSISDNDLRKVGNANGGKMSARAAAFTITGHEIWHMDIITKKYL